MSVQFNMLGSLRIKADGEPSELLMSPKGCALVTYLIVTGQAQTREFLADLLWDASSTAQALHNLRSLLIRIRDLVPELQVTRTSLAFLPLPETAVDFLSLQGVLEGELSQTEDSQLDAALRLYRGDLLANFYLEGAPRFEEWLALERESLRQKVLAAYQRLCKKYLEAEQWGNGLALAQCWFNLDPLNEEAVRACMQSLAARGEPGAGLQLYETFRQQLWRGFELDPEPATASLAARLGELLEEQGQGLTWEHVSVPTFPDPGELPEPGLLPPNSILRYRRNPDFTGRETDLLALARALFFQDGASAPLAVAITGMGGLGKTQLAVEFSYRYGRYFPGGVYWISFANPDGILSEIAAAGGERGLGLYHEAENLTLIDQVGRVQRAWQEPIPRLLIFDNCELEMLLDQWRPMTGGSRVLITSRWSEWSRELNLTCLPLNVLDRSESTQLLHSLAPDLDQMHADKIAAEVGDLPLAIHLAGSFLKRYQEINPAEYVKQLREKGILQHPSLQGHGTGHSPTSHELSVARTYILNWEKLDPEDQVNATARQLLACAASLAPAEPIPAKWLKEIVRRDVNHDLNAVIRVEDGLSKLVNLGFLNKGLGQAIVLHPLLASFTREMCNPEELRTAQMMVADSLAQILSEKRQKEEHLSTLPVSVIHLRHVCEIAHTQAFPISPALSTMLGIHLMNIGEYSDAAKELGKADTLASRLGDIQAQAQASYILSIVQERLGHDQESLNKAQDAIQLFKQIEVPDPSGLIEALHRAGWAHYRLGQAEAALRAAQEGYELSLASNSQTVMARCLNLMSVVNYYMLGNYDVGQTQLEQCLTIYRQLGNRLGECTTLNNMGEIARLRGDFVLAVQRYEEALAIAHELEHNDKANLYLNNLCGARVSMGEFETAASDLEGLISKIKQDWFGASESHRFLAEAYLGLGKTEQALTMAQKALAFANESNSLDVSRAWRVLGMTSSRLEPIHFTSITEGVYDASACFRRSLELFKEDEFERDRAITLWRWAEHELEHGDTEQGQTMWQEAKDIFIRLNLPLMVARMETGINKQ